PGTAPGADTATAATATEEPTPVEVDGAVEVAPGTAAADDATTEETGAEGTAVERPADTSATEAAGDEADAGEPSSDEEKEG
ncbi:MAG: hypothetical protein ACRD0N_12580, partial [Acidimicrobiales bacterium]